MTFFEFNRKFPTEKSAIDYFIKIRYGNALTCPKCGAKTKVYRWNGRAKVVHCKQCNSQSSVFAGTIFEGSSTDMRKWFYAIHLFLNAKKGVSACHLQRELGVTYKTAWRMLMRIRTAMGNEKTKKLFKGIVEIDETYVGGKPRKVNVKLDKEGRPIFSGKKKFYKRSKGIVAKLNDTDVNDHVQRMEILRRHADDKQDKRRYQGAIAGAVMRDAVRRYILKKGFYVIEQTGDTVLINIPPGFKAREW